MKKIMGIIAGTGAFLTVLLGFIFGHNSNTSISPSFQFANIKPVEPKAIVKETTTESSRMFPAVIIKKEKQSVPLGLNKLSVNVSVVGNISTTTFEMEFYNDLNRVLEGELYFPLGENKTVSRFAMDINGELREGVIVEKEKGRVAFENTIRRKIDPGLLEWTKGNNFKARVYPIPAKGTKKIVFAYEQELLSTNEGLTYVLPLGIDQMVKEFNLKVEVFKQSDSPELNQNELTNITFEKWQENYVAKKSIENYKPNQQLGFSIPVDINQPKVVSEEIDGTNYFYATINPKRFEMKKKSVSNVAVVWDVSNSGKSRNIGKELQILEGYFEKNASATISLITFSNTINSKRSFTNSTDLKSFIKQLKYDGGTQLGSVDFSSIKAEEILLFSDGLSNFGSLEIKSGKTPIHTICSNNKADFSQLKFLSLNSGGVFINANTSTLENDIKLLSTSPYRLISYEITQGNISEVYPKTGLIDEKNLVIAGQLFSDRAKLKLNFGFGSHIHHSEEISIQALHQPLDGSIRRLWAQKKLAHLDLKPNENNDAISHHGKKYGLVTRNTSLIILDRIEDYVQHEIVPPKSLQSQYFEIISRQQKSQVDKDAQHIANVKREWRERITWWNTEFKPIELKKKEYKSNENGQTYNWDTSVTDSVASEPLQEGVDRRLRGMAATRAEAELQLTDGDGFEEDYEMEDIAMEVSRESNYAANVSSRDALAKVDKPKAIATKQSSISIKEWSPNEPYINAFQKGNEKEWWNTYLQIKPEYETSPSFYADVSVIFFKASQQKEAVRILSNLAEMELENHQLLRILAYRLIDIKEYSLAIDVLLEVEKIRGEEPQTYRDLGLAYEMNGEYQKAIETLYKVVTKTWDGRFPNIEQIALIELNSIITRHSNKVDTAFVDEDFLKSLPIDVRVVLNWDTDNCDMDLWVTDPRGEKCYYQHKRTQIGGRISNDFTRGYGPEEFMLKKAISGKYKIEANYYGTSSQKLLGPVTLKMQFFTGYGSNEQKLKEVTLRLSTNKEVVKIAEIEF